MSKGAKTVSFKVPGSKLTPAADAWIANRGAEPPTSDREGGTVTPLKAVEAPVAAAPAPKEKGARLTIDLPESLHRRVKAQCAGRGVRMVDVVRDFLEREFPES
ncbi:hypothetical protein MPAR168_24465 [Methylorubrum populi]|uniref:Plasmid segregation centromere-binding protein ParG n=1 Tax=Methylobacterium radiotolerans TaxID=31998 RepID=A0ABU7T623_9HYPH